MKTEITYFLDTFWLFLLGPRLAGEVALFAALLKKQCSAEDFPEVSKPESPATPSRAHVKTYVMNAYLEALASNLYEAIASKS